MTKTIKIKDKTIGSGSTLVIAETACSHDGSIDELMRLIDVAVEGKADMIHFILFSAEQVASPKHEVFQLAKKLELSHEQWKKAIVYTKSKNMLIATTVEDDKSFELAAQLPIDMIKIHSTDNTNPEMLKKAAQLKIPVMLSVGAMSLDEISAAVNILKEAGNDSIILMYGYQNYPTDPTKVNLRLMKTLKEKFNLPVGYADHTDGDSPLAFSLPYLAIALGADVIDKHITMNRKEKKTDYESALNPLEFNEFMWQVRIVEKFLGNGIRGEFSEEEKKYRSNVKKSIVAAKDLKKGKILSREDFFFMRSDTLGLQPIEISKIIGKKLVNDLNKYDNIIFKDILMPKGDTE